MEIKLRPQQVECVKRIDAVTSGNKLIAAATGYGKSVVFSSFERRGRMLILSHRDELVYQPLKYFICSTGVEKASSRSNHTEEVVSASVQTLVRRLKEYDPNEFEVIVTDEAHRSAAPSYRMIYDYFKPKRMFGFTATPCRNDGNRLDDIYDEIIYEYNMLDAIKDGYLCPVKVVQVKLDYDLSDIKVQRGDFAPTGLAEAMRNTAPAIAEVYHKYAKGTTVVFSPSVEIAYKTAELIPGAEVVEGKTPKEQRREILRNFENGSVSCVCNNLVLTEGYDNPRIETIILSRPTLNKSMVIQCLDEKTQLITRDGWKNDVKIGEDILAFDMLTEEVKFVPVLNKVRRKLEPDECFFTFESQTANIRVTNKHRMIVRRKDREIKWKFREIEECPCEGVSFPVSGINEYKDIPLNDYELRLLAWIYTDGHIHQNGAVTISQAEHHEEYCNEIIECLEKLGMKFKEDRRWRAESCGFNQTSRNVTFRIPFTDPKDIESYALGLRGTNKYKEYLDPNIPKSLFNMSDRQFDIFLETMNKADGSKQQKPYKKNGSEYTKRTLQIGKGRLKLIQNMQIMCIQHGYRCNVTTVIKNRKSPYYIMYIKKERERGMGLNWKTKQIGADKTHTKWIKEQHTDEMCWCVETELGTIVTMREGKVAILGNCCGRATRLYPGKEYAKIIDCVGVSRMGLASPASLLGYDQPEAAKRRIKDGEEIDLLEYEDYCDQLSDVPETWVKSYREIDIWAKQNKYNLHDMALRKRGNGELVIGLPNGVYYSVPPVDVIGNCTFKNGRVMKAQDAIDALFKHLIKNHSGEMAIWSKRRSNRWRKDPITEKQRRMVEHIKNVDLSGIQVRELTAGEASIIINEVNIRKSHK